MKNVIAFRRNLIILPIVEPYAGETLAMTVIAELMQFGFLPSAKARHAMSHTSREELVKFHTEIIDYLKDITGAQRSYRPFWKGFPQEVMEKSELELWIHQIVHYLSNGVYEPSDWTQARPTAFEQPKYTVYDAGSEEDFLNIFTDLVSVNQSLTPQDLREVQWFAKNVSNLKMPQKIPFKETLTTLASIGLKVPVKTPTDVLRIAVGLSGGDVSLPKVPAKMVRANAWHKELVPNPEREKFKFKKFTRAERKYLLGLLEETTADASEAVLKSNRWIRLGERLHPGEYSRQFPKAAKMFGSLRNEKVSSWYAEVERAFKVSFEAGLKVLSQRPGEFLRRVDALARNHPERTNELLKTLEHVGERVSNKVLFETYAHFDRRYKPVKNRTIMIKGARRRTKLPDLPALPDEVVSRIQNSLLRALKTKFAALPALGSVWINEELKNIPVPANMRSMGDALKPTIRGQRTPIGNQNAKVIRAYVHWFDEHGREDIDLTGTFLGMGKVEHIGWNGRHNSDRLGCYSGDVRHRRGACAEYIDVKVDDALADGFKYVVIDARNYNGRGLDTMKECVFGYMEREFAQANEMFKPDTLANSIKLQSTSTTTSVAVIDLETKEYIFLDIDQSGVPVASANFDAIFEAIKPYCEPPKFSVYDLLVMHAEARGTLTAQKDEAETKFEYAPFAESYIETLKLMGV